MAAPTEGVEADFWHDGIAWCTSSVLRRRRTGCMTNRFLLSMLNSVCLPVLARYVEHAQCLN